MKNKLFRLLSIAISFTLFIAIFACNNTETSETENENKEQVKIPEPPSMDIHTAALLGNVKVINQHILAGTDLNVKDQYGS